MITLPIRFSPLIYTSLPGSGFSLQADEAIPGAVREVFLQKIVNRHWNAYAPPEPGSCAIYLHQISLEDHLFGWLYCDGQDDFGRSHVPYFLAYYYQGLLQFQQMETILTYLQFGPEVLPTTMEPILAPNLWNYEPKRPGVRIPVEVREELALETMMGKLVDLYVPDKKIFGWALQTSSAITIKEPPETKRRLDRRRKPNIRMWILLVASGIGICIAVLVSSFYARKVPVPQPVRSAPVKATQINSSTKLANVAPSRPPRKRRRVRNRRRSVKSELRRP